MAATRDSSNKTLPLEPSLRPLAPRDFDYWAAHHLLTRAGFGGTPEEVRTLAEMGLSDAVDHLVDFRSTPDDPIAADDFDRNIMRPATRDERFALRRARRAGNEQALEAARRDRQKRQQQDRQQMRAFQVWWLDRLTSSPRPLQEKMTLFWHGHFATGYRTIENSYHMFRQNQLFRSHAAGNFKLLVHAIIHDPAMLRYLNNDRNIRRQPNENLARELMELFTLGEGNGYTESDIKEGARALTGYSFNDDAFEFYPQRHDTESKRIFGRYGPWDGDDLVDLIFMQRYASEHICLKLYKYFVNDMPGDPSPAARSFVTRLAKSFRDRDYDVATILRTIFRSRHFYHPANTASQIKSPVQLIAQTHRALNTPQRDPETLLRAATLMGQTIGNPPSVKGWDGGRSWINTSTVFARQNVVVYLLTGESRRRRRRKDIEPYDATHLIAHLGDGEGDVDPREAVVYLLRFTLGTEPHPDRIEVLTRFVSDHGGRLTNSVLIGVLALIATMPEFQLC